MAAPRHERSCARPHGHVAYARYGAIGLQRALFIGLCTWGGTALDDRTGWKFPLFTLLRVFIGLVGGLWYLLKETKRKP